MRGWLRALLAQGMAALLAACAPHVAAPGPPIGEARLEPDAIVTADGARLPLRVWAPTGDEAGKPKAVLLALHGFGDYSNGFDEPGADWAQRGILVYAYDQRGFGRAEPLRRWAGSEALIGDLRSAARLLRARHPGVKLYAIGESMGGAVIMAAMVREDRPDIDGYILSAPAVRGREAIGELASAGLSLLAHTIPWWPISTIGMPQQASDNIEMLKKLGADPLVQKSPRIDMVWGLTDLMDLAAAAAQRLPAPMLLVYGLRDEVITSGAARTMLERLPRTPGHRVALYRQGWHLLLRDLGGPIVRQDIAAWIFDQRAALPSGADRVRDDRMGLNDGKERE